MIEGRTATIIKKQRNLKRNYTKQSTERGRKSYKGREENKERGGYRERGDSKEVINRLVLCNHTTPLVDSGFIGMYSRCKECTELKC